MCCTEEPCNGSLNLFLAAQRGCRVHGDGISKLPVVLLLCTVLLKVLEKPVAFFSQLGVEELSSPANGHSNSEVGECSVICCSDWIHLLFTFASTINPGCRHSTLYCYLDERLCCTRGVGFQKRKCLNLVCLMFVNFFCQQYTIFTEYLWSHCSNA